MPFPGVKDGRSKIKSIPSASRYIDKLVQLGILKEITGKRVTTFSVRMKSYMRLKVLEYSVINESNANRTLNGKVREINLDLPQPHSR